MAAKRQTRMGSVGLGCASFLSALLFGITSPVAGNGLVDDRAITILTPSDVSAKRAALVNYIWGGAGWPANKLPMVTNGIAPPVKGLANVARVDQLSVTVAAQAGSVESRGYHFIPARANGKLVILHHGHAGNFDDAEGPSDGDAGYGMQRTLKNLLEDGYAVLAQYMPPPLNDHTPLFRNRVDGNGAPFRYFMEPLAVSLNYLRTHANTHGFPAYTEYHMAGLSGGGWTTALYAAIDPSIKLSFDIAGSMPLYMIGKRADIEQIDPDLYRRFGYLDLYIMASYGNDRKRVQVHNRRDKCCFGELHHNAGLAGGDYDSTVRAYEARVRQRLFELGAAGSFRVEIDEAAPDHTISWNTVVNTILAELNGGRRYIGAATAANAFVRGLNGRLWRHGPTGWSDTGLAMVGVPAVLEGASAAIDVFFRAPTNRLQHAAFDGSRWRVEDLGLVAIADPTAVSASGRWRAVALDRDYRVHRYEGAGFGNFRSQITSTMVKALGPAAVTASGSETDIFVRGFNRGAYRIACTNFNAGSCGVQSIGGAMVDFPAALRIGSTFRVYVRGLSPTLWEANKVGTGGWHWTNLSAHVNAVGPGSAGSPGTTVVNGEPRVSARSLAGALTEYTLSPSGWTFADRGGIISGSPTATPGGSFVRGISRGLFRFNGSWVGLEGRFD